MMTKSPIKVEIVNVGALRRLSDFAVWVFIGWVLFGLMGLREPSENTRIKEYCKTAINSELCKQL